MKRSYVVKRIARLLKQELQGAENRRLAGKILDSIEAAGMKPPWSNQADLGCECGCKGRCPKGRNWDYEHMPNGAMQVSPIYR